MERRRCLVGRGWWPLADEAAERLGQMGIRIESIYEKYGSLRLSLDREPPEASDILLELEERSVHICERCGSSGSEVENDQGYVKTLCPECAAKWRQDPLSIRS